MKLQQRMSQRVVMTPLLQQAIQLLQLSTLELEQVVRKELEENPLLEEVPVENTETWPPDEEVSEIPTIGRVKLTTVVFVGGVSEMETLSEALPPPPPQLEVHGFFTPLQEESDRIAANAAKATYFLEFMQTPHDGFGRHQWRRCAAGIPQQHFNPVPCL